MTNSTNNALKIVLIALIVCIHTLSYAQSNSDNETRSATSIEALLKAKTFSFVVESVHPMGGRNMFLNSIYNVKVNGNELRSELPYFGRAYSAPIDPTKSALQFTSTAFSYNLETNRKDGWNVKIIPNDSREVREMNLNVSSNGRANLQVLSNHRQAISFRGKIEQFETN